MTSEAPQFNFLPIQSAVQLHMHHLYQYKFAEVANAFLLKYNFENRFCYTTIASSKMLDEDRFEIVRRMENTLSSTPVYERIIFNRAEQSVSGFTFETDEAKAYVEHYVYKKEKSVEDSSEKTVYDMFLYKNPGLKKMLRFKLHNWGVQTLEGIIKKEKELSEKFKVTKDELVAKKEAFVDGVEKAVQEKKELILEKFNDMKKGSSSDEK